MQSRTAFIAVIACLVLVAAVFAVFVASSGSNPPHCGSCHVMAAAAKGAEAAPHSGETCYACHAPEPIDKLVAKLDELVRMYPGMLSQEPTLGVSVRVPAAACTSCHPHMNEGIVEGDGLRIDHASCAADVECGECHLRDAHGEGVRWARGPSMQACTACHVSAGAALACDSCHRGRGPEERLSAGPWQITHGSKWEQTHGMGDLRSCTACHPQDYCVKCHGVTLPHEADFAGGHGQSADQVGLESCYSCHDAQGFCNECHQMEMPHPEGFVAGHSDLVKGQGDDACQPCHEPEACRTCHDQHVHPGNASSSAQEAQEAAGER